MNQLTAQQRVANGIRLLNEKVPGWHEKIVLATLDVKGATCCPLGQIFGDYFEGITQLLQSPHLPKRGVFPSVEYGFFGKSYFDDEDFNALTEEWKKAVRLARGESVTITQQ